MKIGFQFLLQKTGEGEDERLAEQENLQERYLYVFAIPSHFIQTIECTMARTHRTVDSLSIASEQLNIAIYYPNREYQPCREQWQRKGLWLLGEYPLFTDE